MEGKNDNKTNYIMVEEEDAEGIRQYGITVKSGEKTLDEVKEVTVDREKAQELIRLFNELELATVHFRDVLEDFLP